MPTYLDNAATTAVRPEALDAMLPFLREQYANPSSPHAAGQRVKRALDDARERTAGAIGARPSEIVFTGSGSEADSMAILGLCPRGRRGRFITSAIEHNAVLRVAGTLAKQGHDVTVLPVDEHGFVTDDALEAALAASSAQLVSIMHANNEIGTIQRISRLAEIARAHGALFHTDAVQTVGHIPIDVNSLGVDALSFSAHKFEGPKGVGALFLRRGLTAEPLVVGGGQEGGRRAGTENVAGIVGLSIALDLAARDVLRQAALTAGLRDRLIDGAVERVPETSLNGSKADRLPNNASLRFADIEGQTAVLALDVAGFEVSTGSACTSGSLEPSHVLSAIGLDAREARGTVRFSLGRMTTDVEIQRLLDQLPGIIRKLRTLSAALGLGGGPARTRE